MNIEKINNSQWDMNYASVSFVIQWINSTGHLDIVDMGWSKNLILRRLAAVIKTQFISPTNQIYEKYLVKNTTVKERKRYVEKLNGRWYSITAPFNGYIKGKDEIDEGFKLIWRQFLREEKKKLEISDVRRQSRVSRAVDEIGEILAAMTENCKGQEKDSQNSCDEFVERIRAVSAGKSEEAFVDRLISFYCYEIEKACANRDMALLEELTMDWCPNGLLHDYVWQKIKVAGQ